MEILMVLSFALPMLPGLDRRMTIGDVAADGFRLPDRVSGSGSGTLSRPSRTGLVLATVVVVVVAGALGIVVRVVPFRRSDVIENFFRIWGRFYESAWAVIYGLNLNRVKRKSINI
jgi:hypothetical protein